jgi:hypothetical protein
VPNFDIELADIDDGQIQITEPLVDCEDDDDLPEPSELLKLFKRTPSSETNYSASDIDTLIRDMPLDEHDMAHGPALPPIRGAQAKTGKALDSGTKVQRSLLSTPFPSKRGRETPDVPYENKRARLSVCEEKTSPPLYHSKVCLRPRWRKSLPHA